MTSSSTTMEEQLKKLEDSISNMEKMMQKDKKIDAPAPPAVVSLRVEPNKLAELDQALDQLGQLIAVLLTKLGALRQFISTMATK